MVFKTLHWYIFRELLRIFFLTASALTTLMAFGGTFRPFTKQGIEIFQLLSIMMNLMPAMLAYAIPIAALFAAVLVYWRLSTDNELTACRASGISFVTIVMPALLLGLAVASVDLVFVNYVVPVFLQRTQRAILSDIGSLVVSQVGRQEIVHFGNFVIYADSATQKPSDDPNSVIVVLEGMAATKLKDGKPAQTTCAREAIATITSSPTQQSDAEVTIQLIDASAFDEPTLRKYTGYVDSLTGGEPILIPSLLKSKPKFLDLGKLKAYRDNPAGFPPVRDAINKIALTLEYQTISDQVYEKWQSLLPHGEKPLIFHLPGNATNTVDELRIYAPAAHPDIEQQLVFTGRAGHPVRIDQYENHKLILTYTAGEASLNVGASEFSPTNIAVALQLRNNVMRRDQQHNIPPVSAGLTKDIPGIILPPSLLNVPPTPPRDLLEIASRSSSPSMQRRSADAATQILKLQHTITSELHSRGSFSVSCLTLVLLGAALGILLRGKNPLAVFVVGFVPAVFLVLLITAGRQMAESLSTHNVPIGLTLIWAGNAVLLLLVVSVYAKLLRQ